MGSFPDMKADLAGFVQHHPYLAVYLALGVLVLVASNEVRPSWQSACPSGRC